MKNLLTKILFLLWGITNAQCVTNGTLNSTCTGNGFNGTSCVNGWRASHGTPTVSGTLNNNTWAWLWSHSNTGEGIYTNYNFEVGRTYQISFRVRTGTSVTNPNQTVLNSTANLRAVSGLTGSGSTAFPTALNGGQLIWQNNIGSNINNWTTVSLSYTPTQANSQICFYPRMTAESAPNGSAQVTMEVDDIVILPPVTSVFNFEDANQVMKTSFCPSEAIYLNGTASFGENQYFIEVSRRAIGSTAAFQWQAMLGTTGWTAGQLGVLNLTTLFGNQGYSFLAGSEYQVKVATASTPCVNWVETVQEFTVLSDQGSPAFTYNSFCAPNGTISVTVSANDTTNGLNHWWGLMETSVAGNTTDANTIGMVGTIQSGTSVTFTGLSRTKNYYIKHGVYSSCVAWREVRTIIPQTVSWSGYTTNFTLNTSNVGNAVTVTAIAATNPVFVNHQWSIFYAPNGNTTGSNNVPGNPIVCCNNSTATFQANLVVNQWYYIKHGIWNDCATWGETRKAFRIVIQGKLANGEVNYVVEEKEVLELSELKEAPSNTLKSENIIGDFFPNPITKGNSVTFTTNPNKVSQILIWDMLGKTEETAFTIKDDNTISFPISKNYNKGIYLVQIVAKDNSILTKKLVVE